MAISVSSSSIARCRPASASRAFMNSSPLRRIWSVSTRPRPMSSDQIPQETDVQRSPRARRLAANEFR